MQIALQQGDTNMVKNLLEQGYQFSEFDFQTLNSMYNSARFLDRLAAEVIWQLMVDYTQVPNNSDLLDHYNHLLILRNEYSKTSMSQRYPCNIPKLVR